MAKCTKNEDQCLCHGPVDRWGVRTMPNGTRYLDRNVAALWGFGVLALIGLAIMGLLARGH